MLLKDSVEFPHLYDKGISSKSLARVKTDAGVKLSIREVKLPLGPEGENQIMAMKQKVEIQTVGVPPFEEGVHTKVAESGRRPTGAAS